MIVDNNDPLGLGVALKQLVIERSQRHPGGVIPGGMLPGGVFPGPLDAAPTPPPALYPPLDKLTTTFDERGKRYGKFDGHASITQRLKETMRATPNWRKLTDDQIEALEMVAHKIGRILNGDPNYDDSWVDIAGYVTLVSDRLQGVQR